MNTGKGASDIEKILKDQSWKQRKLPFLDFRRNKGTNRASERLQVPTIEDRRNTYSYQVNSEGCTPMCGTPSGELFSRGPQRKTVSSLAIPFGIFLGAVNSITAKSHEKLVPLFPKRKFGKIESSKPQNFLHASSGTPDEELMKMKIESGRIKHFVPESIKSKRLGLKKDENELSNREM